MKKEFGFYPEPLKITAGPVTISPLPEFEENVTEVRACDGIDNSWIYAPPLSRLFGLRKTHFIEHTEATEEKQLDFHIWALSFFVGMRLTLKAEKNSFVDATPLKPGKLVDFVLLVLAWPVRLGSLIVSGRETQKIMIMQRYWLQQLMPFSLLRIHRIYSSSGSYISTWQLTLAIS